MAFTDNTPSAWLGDGYSADSDSDSIQLNIPELLTSLNYRDADPETGDIGKLLHALLDGVYGKLKEKSEGLPQEDRPTRFVFSRGTSLNDSTGLITKNFSFTFTLKASEIEVAPEP